MVGDFNHWDTRRHPMRLRNGGIWEIFIPGSARACRTNTTSGRVICGYQQLKADPYGFACEMPPKSASVVADLDDYEWSDDEWMETRAGRTG